LVLDKSIELGIEYTTEIPVEAEYGPEHNWKEDPQGRGIIPGL